METYIMNAESLPSPIREKIRTPKVSVQEREGGFFLLPIVDGNLLHAKKDDREALWEEIQGLCGIVRSDIDEKKELMEAREEKYGNL